MVLILHSCPMDPFEALKVYLPPAGFVKRRLGKDNDGGYVIVHRPGMQYSALLSGGISDDISFELDFVREYGCPCDAFDGTIWSLPSTSGASPSSPLIRFVRKNISPHNDAANTNLHAMIEEKTEGLMVKMDIEGAEIPWVGSLRRDHLDRIEQIVMEFHFPFGNAEVGVFRQLNETHVLIHLHANNQCGVREHWGAVVPNVFECTFLHKKYFMGQEPLPNTLPIPSPLDMRNNPHNAEIFLSAPPFVFESK